MQHAVSRPFGLIGFGAIGREIAALSLRLGETSQLASVLVRPGRTAGSVPAVADAEALAASGVRLALECAGHSAVREHVAALLRLGVDVALTSVGALADEALTANLQRASAAGGGRLFMAAGAVGGLDALLAARLNTLSRVSYVSIKPPQAWRDTPAERRVDLDAIVDEQVVFEGSAREAALQFPRNANVAAAVALCGLGLDRTQTKLVASRKITDPLGVIEAEGACGRFRLETLAYAAPSNAKTSLLTANSLLQCARLGQGIPIGPLMSETIA